MSSLGHSPSDAASAGLIWHGGAVRIPTSHGGVAPMHGSFLCMKRKSEPMITVVSSLLGLQSRKHHGVSHLIPWVSQVAYTSEVSFLMVLETRCLRSKCQQLWVLLRPFSLPGRRSPSCRVLTWSFPLCVCLSVSNLCLSKCEFVCVQTLLMRTPGRSH